MIRQPFHFLWAKVDQLQNRKIIQTMVRSGPDIALPHIQLHYFVQQCEAKLKVSCCISVINRSGPLTTPYCIWPHKTQNLKRELPKDHKKLI